MKEQSYYKNIAKTTEYFDVDDIPVVVYLDGEKDEYVAFNDLGNPYSMGKVITEGMKITEKQFNAMAKERRIRYNLQ